MAGRGRLVVFDLDGTLSATNDVDTSCFVQAVQAELGFSPDPDWSAYRHCTDEGIATELLAGHLGSRPTRSRVHELKHRFVKLLHLASRDPRLFAPVPGAPQLLRTLSEAGWITCIATGAWRASAELKLRAAGLPAELPLFCSDRLASREAIVSQAIAHGRAISPGPVHHVVSVGDGVWDVATARNLRLPFVGVARGSRADRLRSVGASVVVPDFSDLPATLHHLETAAVPAAPGCSVSGGSV